MSDPVTNVEIEDVVSSIRRLFAEDKTRADKVEDTPVKQGESAVEAATVAEDRLILTPAFRVDADRKKFASEAVDPKGESQAASGMSSDDSVDNSSKTPSRRLHLSPSDETENLDVLVLDENQATAPPSESNSVQTDAISASLDRQSSLESTIAELEAAISDQGNEFEPDGSEEVGSIPENEPLQWQDADSPEAKTLVEEVTESEPQVIELDASGPQEVDPEFVRRHAAPSDDDGLDETALRKPSFTSPEPEALQETLENDDQFGIEQLPLDEDVLRDLVSEIVRQELQGALGERITRNVRKLVRREIHRIISSQEFD